VRSEYHALIPEFLMLKPFLAVVAALLVTACATEAPTSPAAPGPTLSQEATTAGTVTTVMSGLNSPRGLAWGPEGGLYVVEAGNTSWVGPCVRVARGSNCYSGTGSISRYWKGEQERVVTGLPSIFETTNRDIIGANDISFVGRGNAHVSIGWGGAPALRSQLGELGELFGVLLSVQPSGKWHVTADVAAFEGSSNPGGGALDSNPFGLLNEPGGLFVVDAGGNSLLQVRPNGDVSLVATFPSIAVPPGPWPPFFTRAEAVPTEVTRGPDGALYVSTLTGVPFRPTSASVYRVVPGAAPQVYAGGFTQITDIDWGPDGSLYVLQYGSAPFFGGVGSVIRVSPNGTRATIINTLFHPTGVLVGPDGSVYVSNKGDLASVGEVLRIAP